MLNVLKSNIGVVIEELKEGVVLKLMAAGYDKDSNFFGFLEIRALLKRLARRRWISSKGTIG
jgi:hypothetical protein